MKKNVSTSKRKKQIWTMSVLVLIVIFIYSCHKSDFLNNRQIYQQDETFFKRNDTLSGVFQNINESLTDNALLNEIISGFKDYDKQYHVVNIIKTKLGKPVWDISIILKNENGYHTVVTPIANAANTITGLAFFYQADKNEFMYKLVDRNTPQTGLPEYGNKEATLFTQATLKGLYTITDKNYQSAKKQYNNSIRTESTNGIGTFNVAVFTACYSYTYVDPGYNSVTRIQCIYQILGSSSAVSGFNEAITGPAGGGKVSAGKGAGASNITALKDVKNNIQNPCLKNAFDKINNASAASTDIGWILQGVFNIWDETDLTIMESSTLPDTVDAQTNSGVGGTYFTTTIKLNSHILPNASQEYIAVTIYHEILHSFLDYTGKRGELNQHNIIVNYIDKMKATLQRYFPNLSSNEAEALCWGGLQDTADWKDMVTDNPTKVPNIIIINQNHRKGKSGTKC